MCMFKADLHLTDNQTVKEEELQEEEEQVQYTVVTPNCCTWVENQMCHR